MRQLIHSTQAYTILQAEQTENKLNHTYLLVFNDPRNLRFALKEFAKIFFEASKAESRKRERIHSLIDSESFSDCIILPEIGKKFSVEDAEKIREESSLKPVEEERKLFVIDNVAEATVQAQNKLLKLLEEPPRGVYFLLGATFTFSVLQTVLSRAQKLEIPPFSVETETECLSRLYPDVPDISIYAAASDGCIGAAQNIIDGGYYKELTENALELIETDPFRLPLTIKKMGDTKYKKEFISLLRLIYRDLLIFKTAQINDIKNSDIKIRRKAERYLMLKSEMKRLQVLSENYSLSSLLYAQEALTEVERQVRFNAVFPQCLEICIAKIMEKNSK